MERKVKAPAFGITTLELYGNITYCSKFDDVGFLAASYYGPMEPQLLTICEQEVWAMPQGYGLKVRFVYIDKAVPRKLLCA